MAQRQTSLKVPPPHLALARRVSRWRNWVRRRASTRFGGALASVDVAKRRKLARAAQAWLGSHRQFANAACRFDVVAVSPSGEGLACDWIRSAFTMDDVW